MSIVKICNYPVRLSLEDKIFFVEIRVHTLDYSEIKISRLKLNLPLDLSIFNGHFLMLLVMATLAMVFSHDDVMLCFTSHSF